ncbi:MAG TPA: DUF3105 domain-containing protein [Conexibacter sp.]|nr:DUF3105 domain-containing protein [Conexibacter sp.]
MASSSPPPSPPHRRLRRAGVALLTLIVALAGFVAILLFFESRDSSQVDNAPSAAQAPGQPIAVQRRARTPARIARDAVRLTDDQVLHALQLGDVVMLYGGSAAPPPALRALQQRVSGPFDPVLVANGAAVILGRQPGARGVTALAWRRVLHARSASDPALEQFANYWLGRGAGGTAG